MKKKLRYLSVLPMLFMLFLIFGFSAQDGETSSSLSFRVCCAILSFADRIFSWNLSEPTFLSHAQSMQLLVRKAAHVTEYFLLTLSIFLPLRVLVFEQKIRLTDSLDGHRRFLFFLCKLLLPTFLLAVVCAGLDEFHQSFVPGRCGTPVDVLIDSIGISIGCMILALCHCLIKKRSKHNVNS